MAVKIIKYTQREIIIVERRPSYYYYDEMAAMAFIARQIVSMTESLLRIKKSMKPVELKPGSVRLIKSGNVRIKR